MQNQSSQVFINYANPDQARVVPFFDELEKRGFNVWLDFKRLKPGQNWDFEIKRALEKSSIVIVFLSESSIERRGYVQREIKVALDKLAEKLIDDIYIIPVLLDDEIAIPEQLKGIQCISASKPDCMNNIAGAITFQMEKLGIQTKTLQRTEEFSWSYELKREEWDGLPGYEVELQLIHLSSTKYPNLREAADFVRGDQIKNLLNMRASKLNQDLTLFNHGQDKFRRTNTYDAHCAEPSVVGKVLTISYVIHWYGAGAAHPNMHFVAYSFVMEPLCLIENVQAVFRSEVNALEIVQNSVRKALKETWLSGSEKADQYQLDAEYVDRGTQKWDDLLCFVPKADGLEFLFAPYQVACYADGPQIALVPYAEIVTAMRDEYVSAFGLEHVEQRARLSVCRGSEARQSDG